MLSRTSLKMMKSLKWNVCSCVFNCHESNFWIILLNPSSLPRSSSWISLFALLAVLVIAWYTAVPCFFLFKSVNICQILMSFFVIKSHLVQKILVEPLCALLPFLLPVTCEQNMIQQQIISLTLAVASGSVSLRIFFSFTTAMNFKDHVFPKIKQSTFLSGLAHMDLQTFL